ncbi:MAG: DNA polymerase I [Pseudomonadota bacterium]|jgi:DNA polymerase-1|nr:DNA polymerase I [Alphaproteobacteria bacterium]
MTLHLVDGSGYIFRAYYALPPLTSPKGVPVGAVYGFCNMLYRLIEKVDSNRLLVIFDAGRKTFRQDIYPDYKAHRPPPPDDLIPQFSLIREACEAFGVPSVELPGFEADDLIASYAKTTVERGDKAQIISADKDLMQLLRPGITMWDPIKNRTIDDKIVFEKFGVTPDKVIDVQALCGDSSDNIPGVPGFGPKTSAELIQAFGSLENLLENITEVKQPRRRDLLTQHAELARISKRLVTLDDSAPLPVAYGEIAPVVADFEKRDSFLKDLGFLSLMKRLQMADSNTSSKAAEYVCVTNVDVLRQWVNEAQGAGKIVIDCETTSLNAMQAKLVGIALGLPSLNGYRAAYLPLAHQEGTQQISLDVARNVLQPLFANPAIMKIGHNLKYDLLVLRQHGFEVATVDDTMLMSYALHAGEHGHSMDELALKYLDRTTITFAEVAGKGKAQKTFDMVSIPDATKYAAEDAEITGLLCNHFKPELSTNQVSSVYELTEKPLIPVIVSMEEAGICVDTNQLQHLGQDFSARLASLTQEIYALAGCEFNIASPSQLGEILYEKHQMPGGKKTKTGSYSTDVDVLEKLVMQGFDLPKKVLEWRALAKLNSTYVEGLLSAINPTTGRVHTSYSMVGAATGRLSSSDPNLQNIPIKSEDGRKIRQAFIAKPGHKLVSLDYSQIELRLLAHFADVPTLQDAFLKGEDIHTRTACDVFGVTPDQVDAGLRRRAKTINFGIIYGISAFGLAKQLSVSNQEASQMINAYFERYPGIDVYIRSSQRQAREQGFVTTLMGRKVHTVGILDKNGMVRQFAERQATNAPLQGSNADIIKRAMIKIHNFLKFHQTKLLLQVHDELVFEVPENEQEQVVPKLKGIMENIVQLKVPLVVGVGMGDNWEAAHG